MASPLPSHSAALIAAARRLLAEGHSAAGLQAEAVTAAAGLTGAAFAASYAGIEELRLDLFRQLLDEARSAATEAVGGQGSDAQGLKRGLEAYLDYHLRQPALRELTLLLRDGGEAQALINRRIAGFHRVLQVGFSALRALYPLASAQLVTGMMVEVAQAEYEARRPLPELRETLYAYLDRLLP